MSDFLKYMHDKLNLPLTDPIVVFCILLTITLLTPIVSNKIKIPSIIGLIIFGILIGPFGFEIIEKNSAIDLFSTIGMLYIMFLAGLELNMSSFKVNKYKSIAFGIFTFIIPVSIGFPVCRYVLELPFATSSLISIMFATHTLIAYPIVSRLGISKDISVAVAVGGTILTDTAVFILLTAIFEIKSLSVSLEIWIIEFLIGICVFSVIMFVVVPRVSKWFFRRLENEKYSHYIYVLFILFGASFLAKSLGLEAIIGAFTAGLVLNRLIPHSSVLMNRVSFMGNSLFIPIFLISVGMIINPRLIVNGHQTLIMTIVLTVVAIIGKWLAAFLSQKLLNFTKIQRNIIFGLSSSHVAATLVVILTGKEKGIVDDSILNGTIFLILITCIVASFVTERAALKMVLDEEKNDYQNRKIVFTKNEYILIPAGNYNALERILHFANIIINKTLKRKIFLLSVIKASEADDTTLKNRKEKLLKIIENNPVSDTEIIPEITIDTNNAGGIVRFSKEKEADIIVLDWEKTNLTDILLGATMDNIIKTSQLSMFICDFKYPLATHNKIVLVSLPLSETEIGFFLWFQKIALLVKELSKPLIYYCNENTEIATRKLVYAKKISIPLNFIRTDNWHNLNEINLQLTRDDLLIFVSARQGSISYQGILENLSSKIDKQLPDSSKIMIFPEERTDCHDIEVFNDINSAPLSISIETFNKIKKKFKSIFS